MKPTVYMLGLFACIFYIAYAATIPRDREDAAVPDSGSQTAPDVLHMLNALKGNLGLQKMTKFLQMFKGMREMLQDFMNVSPLETKILNSVSKTNIKLKVLLDVMSGHFPDLHDLFMFMTEHPNSIVHDIGKAEMIDPDFQTLQNLANQKTDLEKQMRLYTGKNIVLKPSLINAVKAGTYKVTPENVNQVNILELWTFIDDNFDTIRKSYANLSASELDYVKTLQYLERLDLSHFSRIVSPPSKIDSTKYTVTGGNPEMFQDPDVKAVIRDLKTVRSLSDDAAGQSKAESLLLEICMHGFRVFNKVMEGASTD